MAHIKIAIICTVLLSLCVSSHVHLVEEIDDSFLETTALHGHDEIWLLTFYAPWCLFCKDMDPAYYEVAAELKSMGSEVRVGRVDATTNKGMAKEFRVEHYPAVKMWKDNSKFSYQGPRTKDGVLDFALRVSGPLVRALPSREMFQHAMSRHDVLFVYIGGSSNLKVDYTSSAKSLIVHTHFFSASRDILPKTVTIQNLPAVAVFKDGTFFTYNKERDGDLTSWLNRERFLYFTKLDSYMLYSLGDTGKLVVLALVDEKHPSKESISYKMLVEKVATENKELYSTEVQFGYMEGNEYINGYTMMNVALPSIIILNVSNDGYFLPPGMLETEEQLLHFINGALDGGIEPLGGNGLLQVFKRLKYQIAETVTAMYTKAPLESFIFLLVMISCVIILVVSIRRILRNSFPDEETTDAEPKKEKKLKKKLTDKKTD